MKSHLSGAVTACALSLGISATAHSTVIDVYFGMNIQNTTASMNEVQLLDITYLGGGSGLTTTSMPAFSSFTCNSEVITGAPCTGMPDIGGPSSITSPTYTNGGDGETSRTIGQTVGIDWDVSGAVPTITIVGITAIAVGATWTAENTSGYTVGLIPFGSGDTELESLLAAPQGDIYDSSAGAVGNPLGSFTATSVSDIAFDSLIGNAFGEFTFAAASPVPVPAAVWLFASGLLGLVGMARRKKTT